MSSSNQSNTIDPPPTDAQGDNQSARRQLMLSLSVLAVFVSLFIIAQIAVAHDDLLVRPRINRWKQNPNRMYSDQRFFANDTEHLLFGVLPSADYSKGGIYFTGASVTGRSLMLWDWPAPHRQWVHNYCVPASTNSQQAQFLHYLINKEGLLEAGGRKTVIFTELFFATATEGNAPEIKEQADIWQSRFTQGNLFHYDPETGITPVPASRLLRSWRIAQLKSNVFWNWTQQCVGLAAPSESLLIWQLNSDSATRRNHWSRQLGPDWKTAMDAELQIYASLIDELHARQVTVVAIYMPQATWTHGYDRSERYRQKVLPLLASRSVEVLDLSHSLDDSDFADSVHLNYTGAVKIEPQLIALTQRYLRRIDAVPR